MITFADINDREELTNMWCTVFDEDREVADAFFDRIFPDCFAPTVSVDGKIVSALFLLPCKLGNFSGLCVYAAMTDKTFRGNGFMRKLLDFSDKFRKNRKLDFLFLVPAKKSLFEYYGKCRFVPIGIKQTVCISDKLGDFDNVTSCSSHEYRKLRDANTAKVPRLKFSEKITEFWADTCCHYGGETVRCKEACGLIFSDGDKTVIRDLTGSSDGISAILAYTYEKYGGAPICADGLFADLPNNTETVVCGMVRTDNREIFNNNYYIGTTLE